MSETFSRTELLLGAENMQKIQKSNILLFGIGGVGGYVAEGLVRSGIGSITLVDNDVISKSNINRQIIATTETIGKDKVSAAKERMLKINPQCSVITKKLFFTPDTSEINFSEYDYVIDAIDTITSKIAIIEKCLQENTPVISCMGTGNKLSPSMLEVADISKTSVCPLARVMRKELKKRGIQHVKVVYSKEQPISCHVQEENSARHIPGSTAFVPAAAGLILASEVIKDILHL